MNNEIAKTDETMKPMDIWESVSHPPPEALKQIGGGRLKGMTDIKPQWRYQIMTETFGPCGIGWKFTVDKLWTEATGGATIIANAQIGLYIKHNGEWSEAIPGVGGNQLVEVERNGPHANDEAYKMAITDALSTAMKVIGVGAAIYSGHWDGSKYKEGSGPDDATKATISEEEAIVISEILSQIDDKDVDAKVLKACGVEFIDDIPKEMGGKMKSRLTKTLAERRKGGSA